MSDLFAMLSGFSDLKVQPKKWMVDGTHRLIRATVETLPGIVDMCIASGIYSLDLETTGLDNRVFDGETVDKIVGACVSPDGVSGYYIPARHKKGEQHNIPWSFFKAEITRLLASPAVAVFHKSKFDQEFLEFPGGEPFGDFYDVKKWECTLITAYLRNTRQKRFGLKSMAKNELAMDMIELPELFPEGGSEDKLDFSELDPSMELSWTPPPTPGCPNPAPIVWEPVTYYGASDAIATWKLWPKLSPDVLNPSDGNGNQNFVYNIEKMCLTATRWMERARIMTNGVKARELIRLGQKEWLSSLEEVYKAASEMLGRDVRPGFYKLLTGAVEGHDNKFDPDEVSPSYQERLEGYRKEALRHNLDPLVKTGKKTVVETLRKSVPSLTVKGATEEVEFPYVYDVLSPQQLGSLLRECKVPGLSVTEKSGQVSTAKEELDRVLEEQGDKYPFAGKIKRFRETGKALSTYLLPLIEDCAADGSLRVEFNGHKVDTGRFAAEGSKNPKKDGGTRFPFHGTPSTYDPKRPECLARIRECIVARPKKKFVSIDFSGVELRIATNLSQEPKWLREFFHCSGCDHMYPSGDGTSTPEAPPPFCTVCGSDKIGDLHTLTALALYGADAQKRPDWKVLRGNGKTTNFALLYGGGGQAVDAGIGCGKQEGWRIKDQYDKNYRVLSGWWKQQHAYARKWGYVTTAFGRRYPLPDIHEENSFFRSKAERNSTNGPVQGTSADITKIAMALVYKECRNRGWLDKVHLLITMHDELDFEIDEDILAEACDLFAKIMNRNPAILRLNWAIPLTSDVEIGDDWTVPWNLVKIRHTHKWPAELVDLFPESSAAVHVEKPVSVRPEKKKTERVRVYSLRSFSTSEVEGLAQLLAAGKGAGEPALLRLMGPNGEDMTSVLMTAWGGLIPEVEAEVET